MKVKTNRFSNSVRGIFSIKILFCCKILNKNVISYSKVLILISSQFTIFVLMIEHVTRWIENFIRFIGTYESLSSSDIKKKCHLKEKVLKNTQKPCEFCVNHSSSFEIMFYNFYNFITFKLILLFCYAFWERVAIWFLYYFGQKILRNTI